MAKKRTKQGKVTKGAPSGFIISLVFHAVAFFVAGLFVVFTVLPKAEPEFKAPPPVERPKMKLKKPKVKVKKSSQPKPSSRIVAKVKSPNMPEIQLPDLMGTGEGLLGGMGVGGEFMDLPEIESVSLMGSSQSIGSDLVGTFYDFKRDRNGGWIRDDYERSEYMLMVNKFIRGGWKPSTLSIYYHSEKNLYASCLVVPPTHSSVGPSSFDTDDSPGGAWMVHYKGKLVHKDGIKFRFVCSSDYFIVIRVDKEIVWAGVWNTPDRYDNFHELVGALYNPRLGERGTFIGNDRCMPGEWITLEPGVPKDIDIIIGDEDGETGFTIAVEEEGVEYEKNNQGGPIYPIFRTAQLSHDLIDQIYKNLPEGEVCVTNGPVFCDYSVKPVAMNKLPSTDAQLLSAEDDATRMRTWTRMSGETFEGELIRTYFDKLVIQDAGGKEITVARSELNLSEEDKEYLVLEDPPKMELDFKKSVVRKNYAMVRGSEDRPPEQRGEFGAKVSMTDKWDYGHELTVEYFSIGDEIKGNRFILLDRKKTTFMPTKANKWTHEFYSGRVVRLTDLWDDSQSYSRRGEHYAGFVITVRDVRGKLLAIRASRPWLEEHLDNLQQLKIGNYFDETCQRTYPTRPKSYVAAQAAGRS